MYKKGFQRKCCCLCLDYLLITNIQPKTNTSVHYWSTWTQGGAPPPLCQWPELKKKNYLVLFTSNSFCIILSFPDKLDQSVNEDAWLSCRWTRSSSANKYQHQTVSRRHKANQSVSTTTAWNKHGTSGGRCAQKEVTTFTLKYWRILMFLLTFYSLKGAAELRTIPDSIL